MSNDFDEAYEPSLEQLVLAIYQKVTQIETRINAIERLVEPKCLIQPADKT